MAARWRAASDEQRAPYIAAFELDKKRHTEQMIVYNATTESRAGAADAALRNQRTAAAEVVLQASRKKRGRPSKETGQVDSEGEVVLDAESNLDLPYCRACSQYFPSLQGMRDHLATRKHKLSTGQDIEHDDTAPKIAIFSEEFLRHNKAREHEIHTLRNSNAELEERNQEMTLSNGKLKETLQSLQEAILGTESENRSVLSQLQVLQSSIASAIGLLHLPESTVSHPKDGLEEQLSFLSSVLNTLPHAKLQHIHQVFADIIKMDSRKKVT